MYATCGTYDITYILWIHYFKKLQEKHTEIQLNLLINILYRLTYFIHKITKSHKFYNKELILLVFVRANVQSVEPEYLGMSNMLLYFLCQN